MARHDLSPPAGCIRIARAAALTLLWLALPASAGSYRLVSGTADGGGNHAQGSRFRIEGTAGQPDAGWLQGQRFTLQGGFWPTAAAVAPSDTIFADNFED